jgi:hypothetical protein
MVNCESGKKFVPGQVFGSKTGPRFVPGKILLSPSGASTFIPGQVLYSSDRGSVFVPGNIVDTNAGKNNNHKCSPSIYFLFKKF